MELAHRADTPIRSEAEQLAFFDSVLESALKAESRVRVIVAHADVVYRLHDGRLHNETVAQSTTLAQASGA